MGLWVLCIVGACTYLPLRAGLCVALNSEGLGHGERATEAISLHWSLTQFTPATNNIGPVNSLERLQLGKNSKA